MNVYHIEDIKPNKWDAEVYAVYAVHESIMIHKHTHTPTQENGTEYDMCF